MTMVDAAPIRSLFSTRRSIDRPIEKVIDYYAVDPRRLRAEVEEYEVTANVERNFRRFLDVYGAGVRAGQVTETGVWVSGFYGSGKSSFTKYLGFALDPAKVVDGHAFLDLLADRIDADDVRQELRTLARNYPVAVVMLDLGAEQLASSSSASVSTVLYWKVLQSVGYSKEEKLAALEYRLDQDGRLDNFRAAYAARFGGSWDEVHNDPLLGVSRAAQVVPAFYPREFPEASAFLQLRFKLAGDVRDRAAEILDLIRRKTGRSNVLFLVDEAGQYVAPRGELILNLDGLARSFKELGQGKVWLVCTGQQTLAEIVEKAAFNSAELNKLRDRFPIGIELDARDIREITWRRLLAKSAEGEALLRDLFRRDGQSLVANTRLAGSGLFRGDAEPETFARLYPFLPQHFDVLLELVRFLARGTGGIGLRSAIRVIQDVLVDTSKVLAPGTPLLADRPIGQLATVDQYFDTLRADLNRDFPHVVGGVDRVARVLPGHELPLRVAKAVGALQPIEGFPRTAENLAALLYRRIGDPPNVDDVREVLREILAAKEIGLVDDPQSGGYTFLSEGVKPLRAKRDEYVPTVAELSLLRSQILKGIFDQAPAATLEGAKTVRAGVTIGPAPILGEGEDVQIRVELVDRGAWDARRLVLLTETTGGAEWKARIAWLARPEETVDDLLAEIRRSERIVADTPETDASKDVAQFLRAERRAGETNRELAKDFYRQALLEGTLIFRGNPTPAALNETVVPDVARTVLGRVAGEIYPSFRLVPIRPATDLAAKFLSVERLDRVPREVDPLDFVVQAGGRPRVDVQKPALAEALRALRQAVEERGSGRIQGNTVQDLFAAAPYGWSKDATRYVVAALLVAGEVVIHTAGGELKTAGPLAARAFGSSQEFGRVGVGLRGSRPSLDALDRAAERLEALFGVAVLPLENEISRVTRERLPARLDGVVSLPDRLRLLGLAGAERAQAVVDTGRALLERDADGAVAVLGATDCTFPDDLRWAETAVLALAHGAGDDVRAARELIAMAERARVLYPGQADGLVRDAERDTLGDVLASEAFYDRLADLRSATRQIRERATAEYRAEREAYVGDLAAARARLEAHPAWLRVSDEDRREIAGRLGADLGDEPTPGAEVGALELVLARRTGLPRVEATLVRELERRAPPEPEPPEEREETVVDLVDLLPREPLRDARDVDAWLGSLRTVLDEALRAGRPLRLQATRIG